MVVPVANSSSRKLGRLAFFFWQTPYLKSTLDIIGTTFHKYPESYHFSPTLSAPPSVTYIMTIRVLMVSLFLLCCLSQFIIHLAIRDLKYKHPDDF
jgi:hypothetical protein